MKRKLFSILLSLTVIIASVYPAAIYADEIDIIPNEDEVISLDDGFIDENGDVIVDIPIGSDEEQIYRVEIYNQNTKARAKEVVGAIYFSSSNDSLGYWTIVTSAAKNVSVSGSYNAFNRNGHSQGRYPFKGRSNNFWVAGDTKTISIEVSIKSSNMSTFSTTKTFIWPKH